jgi:hypothetical protein
MIIKRLKPVLLLLSIFSTRFTMMAEPEQPKFQILAQAVTAEVDKVPNLPAVAGMDQLLHAMNSLNSRLDVLQSSVSARLDELHSLVMETHRYVIIYIYIYNSLTILS